MPRSLDGPLHDPLERNALPERLADILGRLDFGPRTAQSDRSGPWADQLTHDRGTPDSARVPSDDAARVGPAAPAIAAPVVAETTEARVADTGAAALHFSAEIDFNRHMDHYNSQALSAHADWFMI